MSIVWVNDRYGTPFKKVCWDCQEETEDSINGFVFDPLDAGECLEGDY